MSDERRPWDQQPGEGGRAYHAFGHYLRLGSDRSAERAWREHVAVCLGRTPPAVIKRLNGRWTAWRHQHRWVARAEAYDAEQERQARKRREADVLAMRERHASLAAGYLAAMAVPLKAAIERLSVAASQDEIRQAELADVVNLLRSMAASVPALTQVERLARGLPSAAVAVETEDGWKRDSSPFTRASEDPELARLMLAAADRLARLAAGDGGDGSGGR